MLYYSKSSDFVWNSIRVEYSDNYIEKYYSQNDEKGQYQFADRTKPKGSVGYFYDLLGCKPPPNGWRMPETTANKWLNEGRIDIPNTGKTPRYKRYVHELKGQVTGNIWTDIAPINSQAKDLMGYPTQKPLALLERILLASSNPGDIVLDPFSGCGTAIAAAQKLGRRWIGIDITHLAIAMHKSRLKDMFGLLPEKDYNVVGEPVDLNGAEALFRQNAYQFQWWAVSLIGAKPQGGDGGKAGKKGSDRGIDGVIIFTEDLKGRAGKILVQVKGGGVKSGDVRDLRGVIERENAAMGIFLTLKPSTSEMRVEADKAGDVPLRPVEQGLSAPADRHRG